MFKLFYNAFKKEKLKSIIYIILSLLNSFIAFAPIIVTYILFDKIELYFASNETILVIILITMLYYFLPFINSILVNQIRSILRRSIIIKVNEEISNEYYQKLKNISYDRFEKQEESDNFYFIRENVIPTIVNNSFWTIDFIASILSFLLMIMYLFTINYLLVFAAIILAIPYIFINRKFSLDIYYDNYRKIKEIRQTNYLYYLLTNKDDKKEMMIDKSNAYFSKLWENNYKSINKKAIKIRWKTTSMIAVYDFIYSLLEVTAIFTYFYFNKNNDINSSIFLSIVMTFGQISSSVLSMSSSLSSFPVIKDNIKKFNLFMDIKGKPRLNNIRLDSIELKNVSFQYNDDKVIIDNISYKLLKGKKYAFVGENGAGKTTLAKLISGNLTPCSGKVLVNEIYENVCLSNISYVLQNGFKYETSILENIRYGNIDKETDIKKINVLLETLDLKKYIDSLPNGIYTELGELKKDASFLSGGQWQKIAIARALYNSDSEIIIFDEPTSAMDPFSENKFLEKINPFLKDKIVIFITHHLKITSIVDEIIYLENGTITEHGTHSDLINKNGKYRKLYNYEVSMMKENI